MSKLQKILFFFLIKYNLDKIRNLNHIKILLPPLQSSSCEESKGWQIITPFRVNRIQSLVLSRQKQPMGDWNWCKSNAAYVTASRSRFSVHFVVWHLYYGTFNFSIHNCHQFSHHSYVNGTSPDVACQTYILDFCCQIWPNTFKFSEQSDMFLSAVIKVFQVICDQAFTKQG